MRWGWDPMWSFSKILYLIHWRYLICWSSIALEVSHKIRQNLGCDLKVGQCRPNAKLATLTNELWLNVRTILKVIKSDLFLDDCPINMCFSWFFKTFSPKKVSCTCNFKISSANASCYFCLILVVGVLSSLFLGAFTNLKSHVRIQNTFGSLKLDIWVQSLDLSLAELKPYLC